MNIDAFSRIGTAHKNEFCQDYHYIDPDKRFVIIADGCSSNKYTDVGARMLVHNFAYYLDNIYKVIVTNDKNMYDNNYIRETINRNLTNIVLSCSIMTNIIPKEAYHATLLVACVFEDRIEIFMVGDGALVIHWNNSDIGDKKTYEEISFEDNTPMYPYYFYDKDASGKEFIKISDTNKRIIKRYYITGNEDLVENPERTPEYEEKTSIKDLEKDGIVNYTFSRSAAFGVETIAIMTDGVESFVDSQGNKINPKLIADHLTTFKLNGGTFLKRRANKFFEIQEANKVEHYDDFTMAVINFKD